MILKVNDGDSRTSTAKDESSMDCAYRIVEGHDERVRNLAYRIVEAHDERVRNLAYRYVLGRHEYLLDQKGVEKRKYLVDQTGVERRNRLVDQQRVTESKYLGKGGDGVDWADLGATKQGAMGEQINTEAKERKAGMRDQRAGQHSQCCREAQ